MNRPESFPHDWIAPGEYRYCSCGWNLIPLGTTMCGKCKHKDVCSHWPYMPKWRHWKWRERPRVYYYWMRSLCRLAFRLFSSTKYRRRFKEDRKKVAERMECEATHKRLETERNALAEKRKAEGVKPLFWMLQ